MNNVVKEEEKFCMLDHVLDNDIYPFIIHLSESDDSCNSPDVNIENYIVMIAAKFWINCIY